MNSDQERTYDVFLSHAHMDSEAVELLGVKLEDHAGLRVWLDKWVLVPGNHWQQEMARGLDQARTCAVCIGQDTPKGWFKDEVERALNRQSKEESFRVIPILLPTGNRVLIDDFLELRTWVDFAAGIHDENALHVLVSGIRGLAPGRGPYYQSGNGSDLETVRVNLKKIQMLRGEQLIDEDVALEYQRRLLDRIIKF